MYPKRPCYFVQLSLKMMTSLLTTPEQKQDEQDLIPIRGEQVEHDEPVITAESAAQVKVTYDSLFEKMNDIVKRACRKPSVMMPVSSALRIGALRSFYKFLVENAGTSRTTAANYAASVYQPSLLNSTGNCDFSKEVLSDAAKFELSGVFDLQG